MMQLDLLQAELERIVRHELDDDPSLYPIVTQIVDTLHHGIGLSGVHGTPSSALLESLEVISALDGSMPSFIIRNGMPAMSTGQVGRWSEDYWVAAQAMIAPAIRCVGRINTPGSVISFRGTGFQVAQDLILTNRHVLQKIAYQQADGSWKFYAGVHIDFGHEYKGIASLTPRHLKQVVFCPADQIGEKINHQLLDVVVIALEPTTPDLLPESYLTICTDPGWVQPNQEVFIIGYPGEPVEGSYEPSLLDKLFERTYGCKRIAPGSVVPPEGVTIPWTMAHNATTLKGNSGSVLIHKGSGGMAAGIHFGGTTAGSRQNYAHILAKVLDANDPVNNISFRDCLGL